MSVTQKTPTASAAALAGAACLALLNLATASAAADSRDDASPWGIAPGAEAKAEHSTFNPLLQKARVRWLRCFLPWNALEPKQGEWVWEKNDAILADAQAHGMRTVGYLGFLAKWASVKGDPRTLPVKDITFWSDYVSAVATRYKKEVEYWEVWNEFNGGFAVSKDKPKDYAELTRAAYDAVKKADPEAKVGISCANFDLGFFDRTIKAGAADHFDFVCVHPYENLQFAMNGGEPGFLAMAENVRRLLAANKQDARMPLWITEIGRVTNGSPEQDALQADALMKAYILSLAQGFERIFWFEAMGPAVYGKGKDEAHGIIRPDLTLRPAYEALATMTSLLGPEPRYAGWLNIANGGYGFVFEGADGNPVLVTWSPPKGEFHATFDSAVSTVDLKGEKKQIGAGQKLGLDRIPLFVTGLPTVLAKQAAENRTKPFPWGGDYAKAETVQCLLGANIVDEGLQPVKPDGMEASIEGDDSARMMDCTLPGKANHPFRVHPSFAASEPRELEIRVVAKRAGTNPPPAIKLTYESTTGYKTAPPAWNVPNDGQWHENTWKVSDANFIAQWGYNVSLTAVGGSGKCLIKEIKISRPKNARP